MADVKPCPSCGYCPTCGHRPLLGPISPWPYFPSPWPYQYPWYVSTTGTKVEITDITWGGGEMTTPGGTATAYQVNHG